jgi:hypothetical protein
MIESPLETVDMNHRAYAFWFYYFPQPLAEGLR